MTRKCAECGAETKQKVIKKIDILNGYLRDIECQFCGWNYSTQERE